MAELRLEQIVAWVAEGESATQEFKLSTGQRSEAAKTLSAMLNQRGGRVLFGIDPGTGQPRGQQVGDKTLDDLANELALIEPRVVPTIERADLDSGQQIIVVTVGQGTARPYTYRGTLFNRVGATTHPLTRDDYARLVLEAHHSQLRWETELADGWTVADLDAAEITRTIDEAIRRGRAADPGTRQPKALLRGLGLLREGHLVRAAAVLFGRAECLLPDFPQAVLRVARFRGTDRSEFIDNRRFQGNAFDLLIKADRFLREFLPVAGRVVPNLFEREDDPLYPPLALREAVANAICHRDYSIGGGSVGVGIYDDRLEISSTGSLHFGLTVDELYEDHDSMPWNPLIAEVFYRRGVIETWGRGTLKMVELTKKAGLPRPEFREIPGAVVVCFRPSRYVPPRRIGHDLSEVQRDILAFLNGEGACRLSQIEAFLGDRSIVRRVRDELQLLKGLGVVETAGRGKGAKWFLVGGG